MNIKSAAGSQPAAGIPDDRISLSLQSTKVNMTSQTNANAAGSTPCANFTLLSDYARQLAKGLGMEIVAFPGGFSAIKDGDILSGECNSTELEHWLNGYESGKYDLEIVVRLDDAKLVLAELVKAEQVIQSMMAAMTDTQKQTVANSLCAVGIGGAQSACRSGERQEVILTSLPAINGDAA